MHAKLRKYIKNRRKEGYSDDTIKQKFLRSGYSPELVEGLFRELDQGKAEGATESQERTLENIEEKDYEELTKKQLYEKASELEIKGRSKMSKRELINALKRFEK